jgi:type VI secretion system secreted protein VgrG
VTLDGGDITFACPGTFSVKGSGQAFMGPGSSPAEMEGLPSGIVPSIPPPTDAPTLAQEVFSQAIGFTNYASAWLPYTHKAVQAFSDKSVLASDPLSYDGLFTQSFPTEEKMQLSYVLNFDEQWTVEQLIDVATVAYDDAGEA